MSRNDDDDGPVGAGAVRRSSVSPGSSTASVTQPPPPGAESPEEPAETPGGKRKKPLPLWQEVILLLVTAFVLALVVKTFFVQAFYIPSGSMEPTLQVDDKILVQKVSYWNGDVQPGDIVVFDDPGGWLRAGQETVADSSFQRGLEVIGLYPSGGHLVKRVVAVGGDTVMCCERGRVVVNGIALKEEFLPATTENQGKYGPFTVPDGALWVLGDNRAHSEDSHAHIGDPGGGFVPESDVVGKVWAVVWPRQHMQMIERPTVYESQALGDTTSGD